MAWPAEWAARGFSYGAAEHAAFARDGFATARAFLAAPALALLRSGHEGHWLQ
jgi:hypothetical protein